VTPSFPVFKTIEIHDRPFITEMLWRYQPKTSEFTFSNLYIWRAHYGLSWSLHKDWLILLCERNPDDPFFLQPIGPSLRKQVTYEMMEWMYEEKKGTNPRIERADTTLAEEFSSDENVTITQSRNHSDYVYRTFDLINLSGKKYHAKRNHLHTFMNANTYSYEPLTDTHLRQCVEFVERWCGMHRCEEDMNLLDEWDAVSEMLAHYKELEVTAAVICIDGKVEAFTAGELLNDQTAVIHIEKANPEIRGIYPAINQHFVRSAFNSVPFVNREQDMGEYGLRKAKLSYHPDHMVEKYSLRFARKLTKEAP
jgi:hypothetical protein